MDPQDKMVCVNCQSVTTNDGRTVWVCERCGIENASTPAVSADAAAAQNEIMAAAAIVPDALTNPAPVVEPVVAPAVTPPTTFNTTPAPAAPAPSTFTQPAASIPDSTPTATPSLTLNTPTS